MEKKDWKQRLGSYDSWAMNESMFITIDGETIYTLDELKDFISQELDKAREEGFTEEELKMIYLALCDHEQKLVFTPEGKEFYDNLYSKVNRMLGFKFESKLKSKE